MLTTRFTELVGCLVPIQEAAIGSVARLALAAAEIVSEMASEAESLWRW